MESNLGLKFPRMCLNSDEEYEFPSETKTHNCSRVKCQCVWVPLIERVQWQSDEAYPWAAIRVKRVSNLQKGFKIMKRFLKPFSIFETFLHVVLCFWNLSPFLKPLWRFEIFINVSNHYGDLKPLWTSEVLIRKHLRPLLMFETFVYIYIYKWDLFIVLKPFRTLKTPLTLMTAHTSRCFAVVTENANTTGTETAT